MTSLPPLSDVNEDLGACMDRFDAMMAFPEFRTKYGAVDKMVWTIMFGDRWQINAANNIAIILPWRVQMFKVRTDARGADERLDWICNNFDYPYFIWWDAEGRTYAHCREASDQLMYEMKWG